MQEERVTLMKKCKCVVAHHIVTNIHLLPRYNSLVIRKKIWKSNNIVQRRMLLRMAFTDKITYERNKGFRTATFSQLFLLLEDLHMGKKEMVGLAGLEPARPYGQQILSLQRLPFRHRPIRGLGNII